MVQLVKKNKVAAHSRRREGGVWKEVKRNKAIYAMLTPYFLIFFTFTVLPVVLSLLVSFTNFNMLEFPKWVGWRNYAQLFVRDDVFLIALKNTLLFAAITGPISYIACFVLAWVINEFPPKLRAIATLVFYAPALSGSAYIVWTLLFSSDSYGYINAFLLKWHLILEPILWLKTPKYILPIIIIVQLWLSLGTSFLAFIAGLQSMDKTLHEAGAIDGIRNRWQELWFITLPSMKPMLLFGAVIQITASFAVAEVATALAGFPSVKYAGHTIVTHLMDYGSIRFEMGYASSIATVLFVMMLGSNLIVRKLLTKVGE
ncbi:carbohydrate ABC transporter membrane protein 1, CUT1 family (TC 3.A.1.1.-) [Paenibacillus uliginis N3/975]|uniref:Carbohydrate ABC transporter membrane protein 1, CUT1 family (TC 3.A.1.1.-) n=1 Tax=Paenibacillus uliginis N3/975 TaxID=1313296 RepID=A0A1X7H6R8_9BACL|nr:sugar ABC transporter permease [Paenibacillus uliginis]SMF80614.1 carbohydrate ABC transporter membrane protein 1, CUT1 family (TC 3.A.1.1.-) [Paenibacillus uliginis N3/975]